MVPLVPGFYSSCSDGRAFAPALRGAGQPAPARAGRNRPPERSSVPSESSAASPAAPRDGGDAQREIALRARQGDHEAFGQLVRTHQSRIYRHLLNLTGSREEALELSQEMFLKAWQALPDWRPDALFHTWLYRIASNLAYDTLRRRRIVAFEPLADDDDTPATDAGPEALLQARQRLGNLDAALARLPAEQREIVLLREVEGLSYEELAAAQGIDEGTVKSRLARARAALAEGFRRTER